MLADARDKARRKRISEAIDIRRSALRKQFQDEAQPYLAAENFATVWRMDEMAYLPQPPWLIEQLVEEEGLTLFVGPDKVGKTAVLSSFLWSWCAGKDTYLDPVFKMHDPTEGERSVVYLLLEGRASFYNRYAAWKEAYEVKGELDNFFVITEGTSLFDKSFRQEDRATWPESLVNLWNSLEAIKPAIFVVDTFSRATAGIEENSSQVAQVVAFFDKLRDELGIATIVVHHTPVDAKTKRARGHGSLKGAASSHILIDGEAGTAHAKLVVQEHRNVDPKNQVHDGGQVGYFFKKTSYGERESLLIQKVDTYGDLGRRDAGGTGGGSRKTKSTELQDLVDELDGKVEWQEASMRMYGDTKHRTHVYKLVRNADNLAVKDGVVIRLTAEEPETL